jgi:hypothetical protein
MANRFTDTTKWDDDWFLKLSPALKAVWYWLYEHCDGVGVQKLSFTKISNEIGTQVSREDFEQAFADRIHWISEDTIWVAGYIKAQYKKLKTTSRAHFNIAMKAIRCLEGQTLIGRSQRVYEGLLSFTQEFLESHPDLPKPQHDPIATPQVGQLRPTPIGNRKQEIGNRKQERIRGSAEGESFDFESLYAKYPRKEGKQAGLAQCRKQIKTRGQYDELSRAIDRYAVHCAKTDQIVKHFSSFLGSERGPKPWLDWLDPETGQVSKSMPAAEEPEWVKKARAEEEAARRKSAV